MTQKTKCLLIEASKECNCPTCQFVRESERLRCFIKKVMKGGMTK